MELEPAEVPGAMYCSWPDLQPSRPDLLASIDEEDEGFLAGNTLDHLQGREAMHCLIRGPAGVGTSVVAWEPVVRAARQGMRVIQVA
eukprot:scaffold139001_cov40-Prasinocladus_malaysianus.AAC.1